MKILQYSRRCGLFLGRCVHFSLAVPNIDNVAQFQTLCSEYSDYRKITGSSNVERGCCWDEIPQNDPVLASSAPARPIV
ncbi:hypothetical protein J6590_031906 [Homalodisca vitripennis]|nr:hypothetical protein J6590_031906 [Homalodisca vitripennis]